jgi:hypothetical protein
VLAADVGSSSSRERAAARNVRTDSVNAPSIFPFTSVAVTGPPKVIFSLRSRA